MTTLRLKDEIVKHISAIEYLGREDIFHDLEALEVRKEPYGLRH